MLFSLLMTVASCLPSVFVSTKIDIEEEVLPYAALHDSLANSANILDGAQVTVFTHGMGGTYKDWLSKDSETGFVANNDYLPFSLSRDNVFILNKRSKDNKQGTTSLFPVEFDSSGNYLVREYPDDDAAGIIDIGKHIVLIYNGFNDALEPFTNEEVYAPFEIALDTVLANLSEVLGGTPQVNLVGHSRGGLVNLLYALDHPRVVRNLISIGTPYWGSTWGDAMVPFGKKYLTSDSFCPDAYGPLLDRRNSYGYFRRWTELPVYANINAAAISCTQSFGFFADSLAAESLWAGELLEILRKIDSSISLQEAINMVGNFGSFLLAALVGPAQAFHVQPSSIASFLQSFVGDADTSEFVGDVGTLLDAIFPDFHSEFLGGSISSDVLVDEPSQKGESGDDQNFSFGFDAVNLYFDSFPIDAEPARFGFPWVLHNLEPKIGLVKEAVLSLLAEDPGSRHSHDFETGTDRYFHFLSCSCGAKAQRRNHSLAFDHGDASGDHFSCGCGYSERKSHDYDFNVTETTHLGRCRRCERILYGEHVLSAWRNVNAACHVSSCHCGYSKSEPHEYIGTKRRCVCGRFADSNLELNP